MKHCLLVFVLHLTVSCSYQIIAQSDRWVYYSDKSADATTGKFYYDEKTIEYDNKGNVTIWIKYILDEKTYEELFKKYNDYTLMRVTILCKERRYILKYAEGYFTDGTSSGPITKESNRIIKPESQVEVLYFKFCQ